MKKLLKENLSQIMGGCFCYCGVRPRSLSTFPRIFVREAIDDKECEEICNNQDDRLPYYGLSWCGSSKLSYLGQGVVKYSKERLAALDYANGGWRIDFEGSV